MQTLEHGQFVTVGGARSRMLRKGLALFIAPAWADNREDCGNRLGTVIRFSSRSPDAASAAGGAAGDDPHWLALVGLIDSLGHRLSIGHVVGNALPGGYPPADSTKTPGYAVVGCEMCHGPGSQHVAAEKAVKKNFISVPKTEAMCKDCHTAAMSPKFVFDEYKKTGVHVVPAAQ